MELAPRWSSLDELIAAHAPLRLDLGCGWVKEPGCVGLDDLRGVGGLEGQSPEPRSVQTPIGTADWQEPAWSCDHCRKAFFPSVQEPGD